HDDLGARRHRCDLGARRAAVLPPGAALATTAGRHRRGIRPRGRRAAERGVTADYTGLRGAIAQLGERLLCKQEVTGSIPVGSIEGTPCKLQGRLSRKVAAEGRIRDRVPPSGTALGGPMWASLPSKQDVEGCSGRRVWSAPRQLSQLTQFSPLSASRLTCEDVDRA